MTRPTPRLTEVGPRDGLQNEKAVIPLEAKIGFINELAFSGVREIEAGAFVSPAAVPQMADSDQVFSKIRRKDGVIYSALVPNEQGLDRALAVGVDKIVVFTAASETFNERNIRASIAQSLKRFKPVIKRAAAAPLPIRAYISTAFYCPFEGKVAPEAVDKVAQELLVMGVQELSIGDTIGRAAPDDVRRLLDLLLKKIPVARIVLHFHDTYGMAIANALTAWSQYGIAGFDASAGGLGGCPYAPGATGNVAMEDLAFAFMAMGKNPELDFKTIKRSLAVLSPYLGHPPASKLSRIEV